MTVPSSLFFHFALEGGRPEHLTASLMPSMVLVTQQASDPPLIKEDPDELPSFSGAQGSGPTVPLDEQWQSGRRQLPLCGLTI